jgi:3'-5' exoribonuclease
MLASMGRGRKIVRLRDLAPGQEGDFFALLTEKTRGRTVQGKTYYLCRFRDAHRHVTYMAWADGAWFEACERDWHAGQFYKVRATYSEHERYGPQLDDIHNIRLVQPADSADGFDPANFVEHSRRPAAEMFAELRELLEKHLADEPLRRLTLGLLDDHAARFQVLPATRDRYYPFAGGLLEHTLAVVRSCLDLGTRYRAYYTELRPSLNLDLLLAGAALHEIGRVLEFDTEAPLPDFTIPGRLLGHLLLGRDLVRDKARTLGDVNPELLQLLEHVILTHLTLPEWGSPRLPLIPEVILLHHADDLDVKLEMYARVLSRDTSPGPFTERDPSLGRNLLKSRTV